MMKKWVAKHKDYILIGLVVILIAYIAYDKGMQYFSEGEQKIFQQGYAKAMQDSVQFLIEGTANCKSVTVSGQNKSIDVVTADCASTLQQQSYLKGVKDTVSKIISDGKKCQPVPISDGAEQENFIAVSCLQQT